MVRLGIVGLGKMGLSHLAIANAHPRVEVRGIVDSATYLLDVLAKNTGMATFTDHTRLFDTVDLDAVIIATPTHLHAPMVHAAIDRGVHVFCEKPLTLSARESRDLAERVDRHALVTQVGYHNRFVGSFREVRSLLEAGAIGRVTHLQAEAYGPVVLRPKGSTWRSRRTEGGGCLYDYAAHPLDLLSWFAGPPSSVAGTVLSSTFSADTDDEVFSTLHYPDGSSAQLSVNWSDESYRKMTTRITVTGTAGRIHADRQELQVYLRDTAPPVEGYRRGWNVKYTTELTENVWFYLRGEEYSAQLNHFIARVDGQPLEPVNDFASAAATDRVLELLSRDAASGAVTTDEIPVVAAATSAPRRGLLRRRP